MICELLQSLVRFDCTPIRSINGEDGVEIGTPFSFVDGSAIVIYGFNQNEKTLFSDNGETLMHLASSGISIKKTSFLRDIVSKFGLTLTDDGDIRILVNNDQSQHALATTISAILAVVEWEREQLGLSENVKNLVEEALLYLQAWKPNSTIKRNQKLKGQSRKEHTFDFHIDNEYIDVISASPIATGASMRKIGDILNSENLGSGVLRVIIDDREDPDRANIEKQILGSMCKAMTFTSLIAISSNNTFH